MQDEKTNQIRYKKYNTQLREITDIRQVSINTSIINFDRDKYWSVYNAANYFLGLNRNNKYDLKYIYNTNV